MMTYGIPKAAFTSYAGIMTRPYETICSFEIEPQRFERNLLIWGTIEVCGGIDYWANHSLIDIEVLLGDPASGDLIARGFGRKREGMSVSTVVPCHPLVAIPADTQTTLYVNMVSNARVLAPVLCEFNPAHATLNVVEFPGAEPTIPDYERVLIYG